MQKATVKMKNGDVLRFRIPDGVVKDDVVDCLLKAGCLYTAEVESIISVEMVECNIYKLINAQDGNDEIELGDFETWEKAAIEAFNQLDWNLCCSESIDKPEHIEDDDVDID